MSVVIAMSNSGARLYHADARAIAVASDTLAYDVEGASFTAGFKMGSWNGKKTFLRFPDLIFEAGFVRLVARSLAEHGIPVSIQDHRTPVEIKAHDIELEGITLRDYQLGAVEAIELHKRGIVRIATGGGKTEVAAATTKRFGVKTLFLTHKVDLVRQTRERFAARLGRPVGMISEGEWLPADITVATVQTIMSHWRKSWKVVGLQRVVTKGKAVEKVVQKTVFGDTEKEALKQATRHKIVRIDSLTLRRDNSEEVKKFLGSIEFLITDEAHRSSGDGFFEVISNCTNAYYRASLTATPLMKGAREDDLRLIACSGDIIYNITNSDLIKRGILAEPHFSYIEMPAFYMSNGKLPTKYTKYDEAYKAGITNNEYRNRAVINETRRLVEKGRQTVVLVKEIAHGDTLYNMFNACGFKVQWVAGEDNPDVRKAALNALRAREINVLVASTILDEGLDEDSISGIVLAGGGKSKISLFQRVGRAMRARKGDDLIRHGNTAEVVDFIDTGDHRLMEHSAQRYSAAKNEDGWVIDGILKYTPAALAVAA